MTSFLHNMHPGCCNPYVWTLSLQISFLTEPNRTEQNRTKQNRTEQNISEQNKTEQNRTEQSRTDEKKRRKKNQKRTEYLCLDISCFLCCSWFFSGVLVFSNWFFMFFKDFFLLDLILFFLGFLGLYINVVVFLSLSWFFMLFYVFFSVFFFLIFLLCFLVFYVLLCFYGFLDYSWFILIFLVFLWRTEYMYALHDSKKFCCWNKHCIKFYNNPPRVHAGWDLVWSVQYWGF